MYCMYCCMYESTMRDVGRTLICWHGATVVASGSNGLVGIHKCAARVNIDILSTRNKSFICDLWNMRIFVLLLKDVCVSVFSVWWRLDTTHLLTHLLTHSLQDYDHGGGGATGAHSGEQDQQHDRSERSLLNHCMALIHSGCDYNSLIFSSTVLYSTVLCGVVRCMVWWGVE